MELQGKILIDDKELPHIGKADLLLSEGLIAELDNKPNSFIQKLVCVYFYTLHEAVHILSSDEDFQVVFKEPVNKKWYIATDKFLRQLQM